MSTCQIRITGDRTIVELPQREYCLSSSGEVKHHSFIFQEYQSKIFDSERKRLQNTKTAIIQETQKEKN